MSTEVAAHATHGWPEFISVYQPAFEKELDVLVRAEPNVDLFQGETAVGLEQDDDGVTVTTRDAAGGQRPVESRFLIGADGGNSFVREALSIEYEKLGIDQDWLVIDARAKRPQRAELPYLRQFCEPEQPGMTMRMGPDHRRWSFMILPGESLFVLEMQPASYAILATNEAEKAAEIKVVDYRMIGATGRVYLSGEESDVRMGAQAADRAIRALEN